MISQSTIDKIMQAARIEEVVGDVVRLKKKGSNLTGLCPFHQEKTPSFMVSPVKGIYKCFGCGKAGNPVNFVMETDGLSYPEALKKLAEKYHIEIEEDFQKDAAEAKKEALEREGLLIALEWAAHLYHQTLLTEEEGKTIGLPYFRERGFRDDIIEKFGLGYVPDSFDYTIKKAVKGGYKNDILKTAGIIGSKDDERYFDLYRGRVIFPIHNLNGKVIALAGRILNSQAKVSKYINSPESPVYIKNQVLYGAWFARKAIRDADNCYLVEGYTDVITLHQNGVENVVASSGTSLTEGQISLIRRFTQNVTVLYDGDPAGIKASLRGTDMMLKEGLQVWVVTFPEGEDPDSYCRKLGGEAFAQFLKEARTHFLTFKSKLLLAGTQDPVQRAEALRDIARSIAVIPDPLQRELLLKDLSKSQDIREELLISEVGKQRKEWQKEEQEFRKAAPAPKQILIPENQDSVEAQELDTIRVLLEFGEQPMDEKQNVAAYILDDIHQSQIQFTHQTCVEIIELIQEMIGRGQTWDPQVILQHSNPEISQLSAALLVSRHTLSEHWTQRYEVTIPTRENKYREDVYSALNRLKIRKTNQILKEIDQEIQGNPSEIELEALLKTRQYYLEIRKKLSDNSGTVILR